MFVLSLYGLCAVLLLLTILWVISVVKNDASIIDFVWGILFLVFYSTYLIINSDLNIMKAIVWGMVFVWSMRLSLYIYFRNHNKGEDYRYVAMRSAHPKSFWWRSYYRVFLLQGLVAYIVHAPLIWVATSESYNPNVLILGVLVWVLGFVFEALGDYQLSTFKKDENNKGKLFTKGVWALTRHPNYFGDSMIWWGYFICALSVSGGYLSVFGPLVMMFFLMKVSGVALLEKKLKQTKPEYLEYMESTPSFFPNFKNLNKM